MSISVTRISPTTPHPMRRAGDMVIEKDQARPSSGQSDSGALTSTDAMTRTTPSALRTPRPDPAFITHLIATAEQVPQTRVLRRADPADGTAAYRAAAATYGASRLNKVA